MLTKAGFGLRSLNPEESRLKLRCWHSKCWALSNFVPPGLLIFKLKKFMIVFCYLAYFCNTSSMQMSHLVSYNSNSAPEAVLRALRLLAFCEWMHGGLCQFICFHGVISVQTQTFPITLGDSACYVQTFPSSALGTRQFYFQQINSSLFLYKWNICYIFTHILLILCCIKFLTLQLKFVPFHKHIAFPCMDLTHISCLGHPR